MFEVGDIVVVTDKGVNLPYFPELIAKLAPRYYHLYKDSNYMDAKYVGEKFKVVAVDDARQIAIIVRDDKVVFAISFRGIKKEEKKEMTLNDLKTGMIIRLRDNTFHIVVREAKEISGRGCTDFTVNIEEEFRWRGLDTWKKNDLMGKFKNEDDIIEVYSGFIGDLFLNIHKGIGLLTNYTLVWDRYAEEKKKEKTETLTKVIQNLRIELDKAEKELEKLNN